jgi:hypothetical protein
MAQDSRTPPRDIPIRPRTAPPIGMGSIAGRIVSAEDGRPLRRVQVRADAAIGGQSQTALTDDEGRYQLAGLLEGTWTITLSKAGYIRVISGQRRAGSPASPIRVTSNKLTMFDASLVRGGAITGVLIDELGDPVAGASVQALRTRLVDGERRLTPIARDQTDDTGAFRLHSLPSGDYYVTAELRVAAPESAGTAASALPTFFPGTSSLADARRVTIRAGDERGGVSFTVLNGHAVRVSGVVSDATGRPADEAVVQLLDPASGSVIGHAFGNFGLTHDGGRFTMLNVTPGSYLIAAILERPGRDAEQATVSVTVGAGDVNDISLSTAPAATVTGTVLSASDTPLPRELRAEINARSTYGIRTAATASLSASRPFVLDGLGGPTSFYVTGLPKGWAVQRIELDGSDVTDGIADIKPATKITSRVTLTNKTTSLDGAVSASTGAVARDVTVIVFAADAQRWTVPSRFVALARTDAQGRFHIDGLPAGDYLAVVTSDVDEDDQLDADLLSRLRQGATTVSLVEGASASVSLAVGANR